MTSIPRLVRAAARTLSKNEEGDSTAQPPREETVSAIKTALRARAQAKRRRRWIVPTFAIVAAAAGVALFVGARERSRPVAPVAVSGHAQTAELKAERVRGTVAVHEVSGKTTPLSEGATLHVGDRIVASDGTATIGLPSGSRLDVEGATALRVDIGAGTQIVELGEGAVTSRVAKVAPGERFLVRAGEVEIEVRGTIFRVERRADPRCRFVTKVEVLEGRVVVRAPAADAQLSAGERWATACAEEHSAAPTNTAPARAAAVPAKTGSVPTVGTSAASLATASPATTPPPASELAAQNALFRDAMAAKSRGDTQGAIALLDTFLQRYPSSPLHEGAAAQRMRLLAASDPARARSAAREYVARYPGGFARTEANQLLKIEP